MMGIGVQPSSSQQAPDYPMALSKIQVMSKDELQELLDDDTKFDDYIKSLEQIKQLYSEKGELMASNKSLAEYNLTQEPTIRTKRETLAEKHREAFSLLEKLKQTRTDVESRSGNYKPDVLFSLLQVANSEVEKESENIADEFLEGDASESNVDAFLEKFMEKRRLYHMRNVKVNKMKEIVDKQNATTTPSRRAPLPPQANTANIMPNTLPMPSPTRQPGYVSNVPYSVTSPMGAPPSANNWAAYGHPQQPPMPGNLPYPIQAPMGMPPSYR